MLIANNKDNRAMSVHVFIHSFVKAFDVFNIFFSFSFFCFVWFLILFFVLFFVCVRVCMCENVFESIIPIATQQIGVNDKNLQYSPNKSLKNTLKIKYIKVQKSNHLMIIVNS